MSHGISIIVPLYNKAHTIERSLESVFAQSDDRYEVIVVDDGSTDDSDKIVQEKYGSRLNFISQQNAGPSAARNTGAKHAKMKYLLFLDADDELTPDCIGVHLRAFEDYPQSSLSITSHQVNDQGKLVEENLVSTSDLALNGDYGHVAEFHSSLVFGIHLPCVAIDKTVFNQVNGLDNRLRCWEVTDFLFRINLLNKFITYTNKITIIKNEDPVNSQFTREKKNMRYKEIVLRNILERINDVPKPYRAQSLKPVKSMLEELFGLGEFVAFREFGRLACPQLRTYGIKSRLCLLIYLPASFLRLMVSLKRILR